MDLREEGFDYIFYPKPYPETVPVSLCVERVMQYAKPCYVPYGFSGTKYWDDVPLQYSDFFRHLYFFFPNSIHMMRLFQKSLSCGKLMECGLFHNLYLGYPALENALENGADGNRGADGRKYILWTPRWSYRAQGGGSHFIEYKDKILEIQKSHTTENLLIRPHPTMLNELIRTGMFSKDLYDAYTAEAERCGAAFDSNASVIDTMKKTKLLITDYSSIIIEFFLANLPIIYCDAPNVELNEPFREIMETEYVVHNEEELEQAVKDFLLHGDRKREQRLELIERYRGEHVGAAKRIVDAICEDFRRNGPRARTADAAAEKLGNTLSGFCGAKCTPQWLEKMSTQGGDITSLVSREATPATEPEGLEERAKRRTVVQEEIRQACIEQIAAKAYRFVRGMGDERRIAPKPVSKGWMARFTALAGEVEDDVLQEVWARLLAEELAMPGSVSPRTLSVLSDMSPGELREFRSLSRFIVHGEFVYANRALNARYGLSYANILALADCGLLTAIEVPAHMAVGEGKALVLRTNQHCILARKAEGAERGVVVHARHPLTQAGRELYRAVGLPFDENYLLALTRDLVERNRTAEIRVHLITGEVNGTIVFERNPVA